MLYLTRGKAVAGFLGRFGVGVWFLACSHREDLAWSGGNAEGLSFFTFFAKSVCGVHVVDVRFHVVYTVCTWFVCTW
ncbi:hypothetical protein Taro_048796 [Colocasia esculenta]|uniref:Uncharacterized protein n=1 Tax=Colocasia esculenta TaxID=4460 RepID=A0A843X950_COLES|nr:hypothetical protein [Colocasia esculenta]